MLGYNETTNAPVYIGVIHTDDYTVYNSVVSRFGHHHGGCLVHVRRAQRLVPEAYLIKVLKRLPHEATFDQAAALRSSRIAAEKKLESEQEV